MEEFRKSRMLPGVLVGSKSTLKYEETGKVINQYAHPKGYKMCSIYGKGYLVHTLVADAYPDVCGEKFDGAEVDHLDTVRDNNVATNLRWVSRTDNHLNPITRRRMSEANKGKLPSNHRPVESTGKVMDIFLYEYASAGEASRALRNGKNSLKTPIQECCKGMRRTCMGRRWRFVER